MLTSLLETVIVATNKQWGIIFAISMQKVDDHSKQKQKP
jgi:hypothetical protein